MPNQIQFNWSITSMFRIAKCVNTPAGYSIDLAEASADAEPVEGSDVLVKCNEIMLVTKGSFDLEIEGQSTVSLNAGDLSLPQRYKTPIRIVSTQDDSGYTCITPRDGTFWNRQSGFVASGQQIDIETPETEAAFVFIVIGGLDNYLVGSLISVQPGVSSFTATADTHFVHLWK